MAGIPYTLSGALVLPPDDGAPPARIPFNFTGQFDSKLALRLALASLGDATVLPAGTVTDAKAVLLEYEAEGGGGDPISITINGANTAVELGPGGVFAYCSPTGGIGSLAIAHTSDANVRVWVLG